MSVSKAARIQELVQQMKAGKITKSELFTELSQLQRNPARETDQDSPVTPLEDASADEESGGEGKEQPPSASSQEPFGSPLHQSALQYRTMNSNAARSGSSTPERRHLIIQRLFEEKRRQRQQNSPSSKASQGAGSPPPPPPSELRSPSPPPPPATLRPRSEPHVDTSRGAAVSREAMKDLRRAKLHSELRSKQHAECTFRPKIRNLPEQYGVQRRNDDHLSFQKRVNQWHERKAEEAERKRRDKEQHELEGCTFQPNINRRRSSTPSRRTSAASPPSRSSDARRQSTQEDDFSEYGSHYDENEQSIARGRKSVDGLEHTTPHERLFELSKTNKLAELQAAAREEEERRLQKQCTFKPKLRKQEVAVRSRYMESPGRPATAGARVRSNSEAPSTPGSLASGRRKAWDDELTFCPQTNPIHPSMEAAQVYLSNDIVTRLTQPREALYKQGARGRQYAREQGSTKRRSSSYARTPSRNGKHSENTDMSNETVFDDENNRVLEVNTFFSSANGTPGEHHRSRPHSAHGQSSAMTPEETKERRRKFNQFLKRQENLELRRRKKIEQVSQQIARPHTPKLCKKSVEIAKVKASSNFLDRVAKGVMKREHEAVRLKSQSVDPECTFKPQINEKSKRKPARSVVEMSRGDSLRKETKARMMKLRVEQEELQDLSFKPELNRGAKSAEGRLKILTEPETYIQRLQQKSTLHTHRKNKLIQEQEMKELEECTFQPQIHDAPMYVKRIVRSLALAKPSKDAQTDNGPTKPDWR